MCSPWIRIPLQQVEAAIYLTFEDPLMTRPECVQIGATLFLGLIAILVALAGPYIGDRFKNRFLAPRLHVECRNEPPHCHRTKREYRSSSGQVEASYFAFYFTFSIENQGKSQARSCEVVLEEVCTADEHGEYHHVEAFWPTNLTLQKKLFMDINPGRPPVYVTIGHISEPECQEKREPPYSIEADTSDYKRFIFDYAPDQRHFWKIDSRPAGRHLFKLAIVGENIKPVRKRFELHWTGNWTEDTGGMLTTEAVLSMKERPGDHPTSASKTVR